MQDSDRPTEVMPWYDDIRELAQHPLNFFPQKEASPAETLNSMTRLVIYISVAVFIYNQRPQYLYLGIATILVLSASFHARRSSQDSPFPSTSQNQKNQKKGAPSLRLPTKENPYMNRLPGDGTADAAYADPTRTLPGFETNSDTDRFLTLPNAGGLPDTDTFAQFAYGGGTHCKTDPAKCGP